MSFLGVGSLSCWALQGSQEQDRRQFRGPLKSAHLLGAPFVRKRGLDLNLLRVDGTPIQHDGCGFVRERGLGQWVGGIRASFRGLLLIDLEGTLHRLVQRETTRKAIISGCRTMGGM